MLGMVQSFFAFGFAREKTKCNFSKGGFVGCR